MALLSKLAGLIRRALTRPLWLWETKRPRPIRRAIFRLRPMPVGFGAGALANGRGGLRLLVLAAPGTLADAAWTAQSFLRQLEEFAPALTLLLDAAGDSPAAQDAQIVWKRLFPGSEVRLSGVLDPVLAARAPAVAALARKHPLGRKLAGLLHYQTQGDVIYADSDVLLFAPAPELEAAIRAAGPPLYNQDVGELHGEPELLAQARRIGAAEPAGNLNSGLLYLPQGCLDIDLAERLLGGVPMSDSWFIEQTVIALLMGAAGARALPAERYVVSTQGQFYFEPQIPADTLVARHYTTPVRHLMYGRAMPLLWRRWRG